MNETECRCRHERLLHDKLGCMSARCGSRIFLPPGQWPRLCGHDLEDINPLAWLGDRPGFSR